MAEVIRMPRLSDTMEEGVIVEWLKQVGDKVEPGDVLAEVETDKATMELENFHDGYLLYIGVEKGAVPVNGILAVIGEEGEDYQSALDSAQADGSPEAESEPEKTVEPAQTKTPALPDATSSPEEPGTSSPQPGKTQPDAGKRIKASPLARSIASEAGVSLADVKGSGDGGRVVKKDVEDYLESRPAASSQTYETPPAGIAMPAANFEYGDHPVSQMRKTIARRLGESKFSAPHFYLTIEIDMTHTFIERKKINAILPEKVSFNDLVIKAAAMALRKHPKINASWKGDTITYHKDIHMGVAVAVEEGLLVPVIRHADYKSLGQINNEVKDLATRARNRKLGLEEMQGNTFTISNLGMFGIDEFTAIINPPDACILAVGGIMDKPVVRDGQVLPGKLMKVTLSCDHRIVDGATGAQFLQTLKMMLENPVSMLA